MTRFFRTAVLAASVLASLTACVSAPTGPTVAIMPREGKPFEVFQQEDQQCRGFAANSIKDSGNAALRMLPPALPLLLPWALLLAQ
jgi:hypothetical protein